MEVMNLIIIVFFLHFIVVSRVVPPPFPGLSDAERLSFPSLCPSTQTRTSLSTSDGMYYIRSMIKEDKQTKWSS